MFKKEKPKTPFEIRIRVAKNKAIMSYDSIKSRISERIEKRKYSNYATITAQEDGISISKLEAY